MICLLLVSCNGYLDITPEGQVKREDLLETKTGIENALYGAYAKMRGASLYGQELHFNALEIMAQTLYRTTSPELTVQAIHEYNYTYSGVETLFSNTWTEMYKNISNVNSILAASRVADADSYPFTLYKGEALGLRAFMHFDLVRLFCPQVTLSPEADGIPYATQFSLVTPPFESLDANYAHIIADLKEAEALLAGCQDQLAADGSNFARDQVTHMNLHAVRATLARIYLTKGDKALAAEYAQKVIDGSTCRLNAKTDIGGDVAGKLSKRECIFGIYYKDFFTNVNRILEQTVEFYTLYPRADMEEMYNNNGGGLDYRQDAYIKTIDNGGADEQRFKKLTDPYELSGSTSSRPEEDILGINLIRLPEMYYIIAECQMESNYPAALQAFDAVVTSRGLPALESRPATENTLTMDVLNEERMKELVGEGQLFFNYKRLNLPIKPFAGGADIQPDNSIFVVPIPDNELGNRY